MKAAAIAVIGAALIELPHVNAISGETPTVESYDYYGGLVKKGNGRDRLGIKKINLSQYLGKTITAWSVNISTFIRLHVDVWMSQESPMPKEGHGVFAHCKTGDGGVGQISVSNIKIPITGTGTFYLNAWDHNMSLENYFGGLDWHCSMELYIE